MIRQGGRRALRVELVVRQQVLRRAQRRGHRRPGLYRLVLGQHHHRRRVVDDAGQPCDRVGAIEGQIGGAGPENRQQRHDEVRRSRQRDAHEGLGSRAAGDEGVGHLLRSLVELTVGERRPGEVGEGDGVGPAARGDPEEAR